MFPGNLPRQDHPLPQGPRRRHRRQAAAPPRRTAGCWRGHRRDAAAYWPAGQCENGRPLDRHTVTRLINKAAAAAGIGHVHPHQLRHTLATQAINRGMSLEAIAALLGHHSMDMTLRYAKIANRTVAEEYFAVTDKVEALYGQHTALPADAAGPRMTRLRRDHFRLLGNGYCTRPPELDCAYEQICETCTFFQTSIEFRPTLQHQHDDAANKGQTGRQQLFGQLLTSLDTPTAS
jgi:hypothetical protein